MKKYAICTDEALAQRYMEGDDAAFDELLDRTQQKLFTYILFIVRDQDKANDVFQDTFVRAISKLRNGQYSQSGKFCYWLIRIAHNVLVDNYRKQRTERRVEMAKDNDLSALDSQLSSQSREDEYVTMQVMSDVRNLMDALPLEQREVVFMRYYQELSFKEISEITGVSINTSLGRMRYAILNMRRIARQNHISLNIDSAF